MPDYMLKKIISGGQTGADRAALDAALESKFPCGGYCPKDRKAEDGPIDPKYPLTEIEGGYRQRTWQNVIHSDGTVIFFENEATGGTLLTIKYCQTHRKTHLIVDVSKESSKEACAALLEFIQEYSTGKLNVAGSRTSDCPEMYSFVLTTVLNVLKPQERINPTIFSKRSD